MRVSFPAGTVASPPRPRPPPRPPLPASRDRDRLPAWHHGACMQHPPQQPHLTPVSPPPPPSCLPACPPPYLVLALLRAASRLASTDTGTTTGGGGRTEEQHIHTCKRGGGVQSHAHTCCDASRVKKMTARPSLPRSLTTARCPLAASCCLLSSARVALRPPSMLLVLARGPAC